MPRLALLLLVALTAVSALQWPAHTAHVHVQRFSSLARSGRSRALWATDDQKPPPPPERTSGTGEWADWENDAHVDDPWDPDEALDPSFGEWMHSLSIRHRRTQGKAYPNSHERGVLRSRYS
jgi:hypothetical protein